MVKTRCLVAASWLVAGAAGAQDPLVEAGVDSDSRLPLVSTPTRLRQSLADVPASVTVINAETLRRFGITTVPDALALVPGMAVTRATGPDYRIAYHGTNVLSPRRMNVMIDGISVYRPAFSVVEWGHLPIVVEDIDRIEVTRGPDSAAYGPNSMMAVVNILTKSPRDVERGFVSLRSGSQGTNAATARAAVTFGATALSLTVSRADDGGYDTLSNASEGHDATRLSRLNVRSHTELSATSSLELQASIVRGVSEVGFADSYQVTFPDQHVRDVYLGGIWHTQWSADHEVQISLNHASQRIRQSWRTCPPTLGLLPPLFDLWRSNRGYVDTLLAGRIPSGGTATDNALAAAWLGEVRALGAQAFAQTCVTANQDSIEHRTDLEAQDTVVWSEKLRTVAGAGARHLEGDSATYLGGARSSAVYWLFGNVEYRPASWLSLNAGGYHERRTGTESTFSPRIAANLHISPEQTVRLALSKGTRSPDIREQEAVWSYTVTDLDPPLNGANTARIYQSAVASGGLVSERVRSIEAGYLLNLQPEGVVLDVKVFQEKLTHLISERLNLVGFAPSNRNSVELRGAEFQSTFDFAPRWSAFLNYAYLDNRHATSPLERTQYSRHSGSMGMTHAFDRGWRTSLMYQAASGDGTDQSSRGRLDLTVSKRFDLNGFQAVASLAALRFDNPTTRYSSGSDTIVFSRYDRRLQWQAQLTMAMP